jgi:hypothetical protein
MSVRENVQMALLLACRPPGLAVLSPPASGVAAEADALLDRVGMRDQAERPAACWPMAT